jgi:hypothetical protein
MNFRTLFAVFGLVTLAAANPVANPHCKHTLPEDFTKHGLNDITQLVLTWIFPSATTIRRRLNLLSKQLLSKMPKSFSE